MFPPHADRAPGIVERTSRGARSAAAPSASGGTTSSPTACNKIRNMPDLPRSPSGFELPGEVPRASEAQLHAVIENIDEGLVIADASGAVVVINERARAMIGYEPDDGRRHHISEFPRYLELRTLDGRELSESERPMARLMAAENFTDYELRCRQLATNVEWVGSFVGTALRGPDGRVELAVLSGRDVTERKRAEEALQEAARQKDAFIAALAHELRNPLAPILTAAQLLERSSPGMLDQSHLAGIIARQAAHLARIVDDLLDVSRITSGRITLRPQPLDLAGLVRQAAEDHRPSFEHAEVRLTVQSSPQQVWVEGDPTRLAQILENLLSNALKFTDAGGEVAVGVDLHDDRRWATVAVRDTGIGIGAELQTNLWEPFSQGAATPRHGSAGLGLGTALVKGLAELHGGHVAVASAGAGEGAEFVVTLPAIPPQPAGERHDEVDRADAPGSRVLVIEDNADVADALADAVTMLGGHPRVARDGAHGVRVAQEWRPDVILCDIGLPDGFDGYSVARALRADGYRGRLVAITGFGRPEDRDQATMSGFDDHQTKPVPLDAIARLIGVPNR